MMWQEFSPIRGTRVLPEKLARVGASIVFAALQLASSGGGGHELRSWLPTCTLTSTPHRAILVHRHQLRPLHDHLHLKSLFHLPVEFFLCSFLTSPFLALSYLNSSCPTSHPAHLSPYTTSASPLASPSPLQSHGGRSSSRRQGRLQGRIRRPRQVG